LFVKEEFKCTEIENETLLRSDEQVWCTFDFGSESIIVSLIYGPPNSDPAGNYQKL
jgi:hypothetical protein